MKKMKKLKKVIALVLFLCLFVSLLPPVQVIKAAEVTRRYELDTDGIDVGATYLIVNTANTGNANALRFYYQSSWSRSFQNQALTVKKDGDTTYVEAGFANEADCLFTFTSGTSGAVKHGDYSVYLSGSQFAGPNDTNQTLTFTNQGAGQYYIQYAAKYFSYYLRCNGSSWSGSMTKSGVYLYKLVENAVEFDVTFDGNGYTTGTLPENVTIGAGDTFNLPAPSADLRKDIGDDTWLFLCWNTEPDGSGIEYAPGETITVTENMTLYADWYQQTKYTVSMITYMDGVPTDVDKFAGYDRQFYAMLEGGDGSYIELTRREEGTYSAKVVENGTYVIYAITADGRYEPVHGHTVIIYNQDGTTECMHYSVSYDTNGGTWADGEAPAAEKHHFGETVIAHDKTPTREGYHFLGWKDQDGNVYAPGALLTAAVDRQMVLTAVWEDLITVTVNVVLDHNAITEGDNNDPTKHDVTFTLLREENGVNLPVEEKILTEGYVYDAESNTTTYQVVFENLPQGSYHVSSGKSYYETTITYSGAASEDQTVDVMMQFAPSNFDLTFDVQVTGEKQLMPQAVNVKVSYWGYDQNNVLGWHIISQQLGENAPVTVNLDENGTGTGFFPVWKYWVDGIRPYEYRIEVTSFVMPDGTIVAASGDKIVYTAEGSGLYTATVSLEGGQQPEGTDLFGAYYDGTQQAGKITLTLDVTPMTVTFDAGEGKIEGKQTLTLENRFRYPELYTYTATPNDASRVFMYWADENGNPVTDLSGQLLPGNVTVYARYSENITISGTVTADTVYEQDGQTVKIHDVDRVRTAMVVLQKRVGDVYNDVTSATVTFTYQKDGSGEYGMGSYEFTGLPNDGTEYRVHLLVLNYNDDYDNDQNGTFTKEEAVAQVDPLTAGALVNIHLDFAPESYIQEIRVNAAQIHKDLRPTGVLSQILYRDLGDVHQYQVISQHTVEPYGIRMELPTTSANAVSAFPVWNWHTGGTPYEYQLHIETLYGNDVAGAYSKEGTAYTADSPFTISYGIANNSIKQLNGVGNVLEATLIPKEYHVHFDMNLGEDIDTPVLGMEDFVVDDDSGREHYAFVHTWSYAESFTAYPFREGYVFKGWTTSGTDDVYIQDGTIHVGNTLAKDITLTANWEKLSGTDYTIRYLELNTDKVLQHATMVSGSTLGSKVVAADNAPKISGYVYAGAMVGGTYISKENNPALTVSNDPAANLLVIYYLPDGSDGYTEQVESNLGINKNAVLENNGTYTITLDTYTKDNPITTLIQQNTPLDIVLVLDQSGSMYSGNALDDLRSSAENFISLIAEHGRKNEVDHRIAIVGYASDEYGGYTSTSYPTAGKDGNRWVNTGVFDSNGNFNIYPVTGFNYTQYTGSVSTGGEYYTYAEGEYLLLTYHTEYRHLITEEEARVAALEGQTIYGYVYDERNVGSFVELTRNSSGLWLYGNKLLYSGKEFFTYHTDVWTHRHGLERREIHAYGVGASYREVGEHSGIFTRTATRDADPQKSIYKDALVPTSLGANGSGGVNPGLLKATQNIGGNGMTFVSYGVEMANSIFEANPLDPNEGRIRIMLVFTDGKPGDSSNFDENESNKALALAYETTHTYGADIYTIGLYGDDVVAAESDQDYFMNGLSSNYPDAKCMDDVWLGVTFQPAQSGYRLDNGGPYFVEADGEYRTLSRKSVYENKTYYTVWGYTNASGQFVNIYKDLVSLGHPVITNNMVNGNTIYRRYGNGYETAAAGGYYTVAEGPESLNAYFANAVQSITTKITTEIVLESDTILRDIMNQGLVLTDGTVITVYTQEGNFNTATNSVDWAVDAKGNPILEEKVSLTLGSGATSAVGPSLGFYENGEPKPGVAIHVYNLDAANATDPDGDNYSPHAVDITGYDFHEWYVSESHTKGYKMVVTITCVEATDDVQWGRSTATNNDQSGLWLPADDNGNRQLLLPFEQPTTIFVERAYVLDYGKTFNLSGWYFDDEDGKYATPVHLDCNVEDGMNWFDPAAPNTANAVDGEYGNTKYGNVQLLDGVVSYTPTTMQWGGYDQFYVFGNTWRKTVLAQDANENGNHWNKVTVIPANNIYYEDSFITTESGSQNGIEGFTFTGTWSVVGQDRGNMEDPEKNESGTAGDVHGWTDSLADDQTYTDGSAHATGLNGEIGASAEFTFTGTGVEVYTRTNAKSGMVVAILSRITKGANGQQNTTVYQSLIMDNLAASGDYYHIPTVSFSNIPYGTYKLQLIASSARIGTEEIRYEYYIDGIRVYNPLGTTTNYQSDIVKDAYGLETNAVFTEVRDILLDYGDFNTGMPDDATGIQGAVFIDWIQDGQESGNDTVGTGKPTYELGTFEKYGPKNEVYLSAGQAIVIRVEEDNHYYVGLKSLTGQQVTANLSGTEMEEPTAVQLSHSTDMYYRVTPVDGYIVIQNGNTDGAILSVTNLRTTNLTNPATKGGVLPIGAQEAVRVMSGFSAYMLENQQNAETEVPQPEEPQENLPSVEDLVQAHQQLANALFADVRRWLED